MRIFVPKELIKNSEIEPVYSRLLTLEPDLKRDRSTLDGLKEKRRGAKLKEEEARQAMNNVNLSEEITIPIHSKLEKDEYADRRVEQRRQAIKEREEMERARLQREYGVITEEIRKWEKENLPEIERLEKVVMNAEAEYEAINKKLDGYFVLDGINIEIGGGYFINHHLITRLMIQNIVWLWRFWICVLW